MTSRLLRLSHAATLLTLVVLAWQVNFPIPLPQFGVISLPSSRFDLAASLPEIVAAIAIAAYVLAGWPNSGAFQSRWNIVFVLSLGGLLIFGMLSVRWAADRELAVAQALHVLLWAGFALLILCAAWPSSEMAFAFLAGLLIHSFAGFIQLSLQPVVSVIPQNSGVSVVFNGAEHWQRIYGLSPHPNVLGGHLAVGLILTAGLIMIHRGFRRYGLIAAWLVCWIALLLTFSRSAWLAVMGGGIAAGFLLRRGEHIGRAQRKWLLALSIAGLVIVIMFAWWFQPFLVNRLDVTLIPYETQAIVERLRTIDLALQIFAAHPLTGVGLSQFAIVAGDLVGRSVDWVHNVPLLAASELGLVGVLLISLLLSALVAIGIQRWRTRTITLGQALVGGSLIALGIAMQFDHYVWTAAQGGLLWAWLAGWWLRPTHRTKS